MEATFFIHKMSDDIFENEWSERDSSDIDNNRLVSRGKAIQKDTNYE